MKYFLHDTNAFQDEKITELFIQYGYEGLGLFYTILEKLALQEKPVKTIVLKRQLEVGKKLEKIWNYLEDIGLISSNNGETFNENLLKFSEKYQIKKENSRERVAKFREKRAENQQDTENVTRYNDVTKRECNAPKVNESKVNKEGIYIPIAKSVLDHMPDEIKKPKPKAVPKTPYREKVLLTEQEYLTLITQHGKDKTEWMLDRLNDYKLANGKKYESDAAAIRTWVIDSMKKDFAPAIPTRRMEM